MPKRTRKIYDDDFKQKAVDTVREVGITKALRQMNMPKSMSSTLWRWMKQTPLMVGQAERAVVRHTRQLPSDTTEAGMFQVKMTVPSTGICLKLDNGAGMIGTLGISQTGLKFSSSNAKKRPARELPFEVFNSLMTSGLLG